MNFLSSKVKFLTLFFLIILGSAQAQTSDCGAAGTEEVWVIETSTNSIEVAWVEVPGVGSYRVNAVDVLTNTLVATGIAYAPNTQQLLQGLQPDREYDITVISLCDDGSPGGSNTLRARTTIIVVDIVMSLDCLPTTDNPTPQSGAGVPYGASLTPTSISFGNTNVLVLEGSVNNFNQNFQLVFENQMNATKNELKAGVSSSYSQYFRITPLSAGEGVIEYNHNNQWQEMAIFKPFYGNHGTYLSITWKKSVIIDVFNCNTTTFGRRGSNRRSYHQGDRMAATSKINTGFQIAPNPASGPITIEVPETTPLEIYDMQGRTWCRTEANRDTPLRIDANAWPAGMYIIRTQESGRAVIHRFVKAD